MVSQMKGVCDIRHAVHSDELFALRPENRNGSNEQDVCDTSKQVSNYNCVARLTITQMIGPSKLCVVSKWLVVNNCQRLMK